MNRINETANTIWCGVSAGLTCDEIAKRLCAKGAPADDAETFVDSAVSEWLRLGYLIPTGVARVRAESPHDALVLSVGGCAIAVQFFGDADARETAAVFRQFSAEGILPSVRLDVVGWAGRAFVFLNDAPVGMCEPRQVVPQIKTLIVAEYSKAVSDGFLAHGAMVSANGKRLLLSGAPGAGKTTLTLALASSGFAYAGDDIVHVGSDGTAVGVPFPAAAKLGSWPLLQHYLPELITLPVHERTDGVTLRYIALKDLDTKGPLPLDVILFLKRTDEAEARLEPVAPLEALCALLDSGWSERHFTELRTVDALSRDLSRAGLYRLVYSDLANAVGLVRSLVDE